MLNSYVTKGSGCCLYLLSLIVYCHIWSCVVLLKAWSLFASGLRLLLSVKKIQVQVLNRCGQIRAPM